MIKKRAWQPSGCEQFAAACRVCGSVRDEKNNPCERCKKELESGFVFDPYKYMELYGELTKKRYWIGKGCNPVRIDLVHESEELKAIKEDRDFWRRIADKALRAIVDIAKGESQ
jgi:predicted amidophosphoribosyltransferase